MQQGKRLSQKLLLYRDLELRPAISDADLQIKFKPRKAFKRLYAFYIEKSKRL